MKQALAEGQVRMIGTRVEIAGTIGIIETRAGIIETRVGMIETRAGIVETRVEIVGTIEMIETRVEIDSRSPRRGERDSRDTSVDSNSRRNYYNRNNDTRRDDDRDRYAQLRGYDFDIVYRRGLVNANADALSRNPVVTSTKNPADMSKQQLFELADMQEKENNELPAEIDHPPGRIWRVRTRRYKKSAASNEEKQDDKERFNNESSSDSDDSLMPAAKIEAAEESSHNSSDDGDVDGDVSMLSPLERKAKTKAREKITEIVNAGKRPRKQKPADQTRASVIRAASVDSQQKESQSVHEEPKASDSDASLEEYTLHPVAQKSDIATSSALYSRSQESQGVLQTASANIQPLHDDYDSSQNKAIHEATVEAKTQEHARRSFPEFAREMSAKLRVDLRENVAANKRGLRIDVWEVDSDEEQSQNKKGPVRDAQISDIKIANANVQSNNDNDAVASNEIFEALQSRTWADYDLDNAQISSDARQLRGYSEQQECADTSATLIRSDDIPSKPPGNCLFYSLIKYWTLI
ncbi:unnamed protein product [Trichogramma brassicae]|uniref:Uncharacterized protein n=1 Tax=Trichogramma brassicae TaxID=86971 RepID=A0A6H5IQ44_9HYME|nr:unnamed protein product [Trichogramma brassicae]